MMATPETNNVQHNCGKTNQPLTQTVKESSSIMVTSNFSPTFEDIKQWMSYDKVILNEK